MANETNLYNILSSLYQGEVKINTKLTGAVDHISGVIGADYAKPAAASGTIAARLTAIEAAGGTKLANADGTNNGLVAGNQGATPYVSIANGVVTVLSANNAKQVEHSLTLEGINKAGNPFNGSADLTITSSDIISWTKTGLAATAAGLAGAADVYNADAYLSGQIDAIGVTAGTYADNGVVLSYTNRKVGATVAVDGKTIERSADGLKSVVALSAITANDGYASSYALVDKLGNKLGADINIPKDQFLKNAEFVASAPADAGADFSGKACLKLTFELAGEPGGTEKTVWVDVNDLVDIYTAGNGIDIANNVVSIKRDATSEAFLTVGADGLKLSGVQNAIDTAVAAASGNANAGLTALSAALTNYTAANAVSDKFTAVDGRLDTVEAKLGDAGTTNAHENDIFIANTSGYLKDSGKQIGGEDFKATPDVNTVATEKAVYDLIHTDLSTLASTISTFVEQI